MRSTESPSTPDPAAGLTHTVLQTVFEGSPIGVGVCDEEGRFLAVNPALTGMLGQRREEMIGRPFLTFVHPEQRSASLACYFRSVVAAAAASPPTTEHTELRCLSSDGSVVSVSVTWTITKPNKTGQQYGLVHLSQITQRRHSEAGAVPSLSSRRSGGRVGPLELPSSDAPEPACLVAPGRRTRKPDTLVSVKSLHAGKAADARDGYTGCSVHQHATKSVGRIARI